MGDQESVSILEMSKAERRQAKHEALDEELRCLSADPRYATWSRAALKNMARKKVAGMIKELKRLASEKETKEWAAAIERANARDVAEAVTKGS